MMHSARAPIFGRLSFAILAALGIACPAAAAPETRTGTFHITATIYYTGHIPAGTTVSASAGISLSDNTSTAISVSQSLSCGGTVTRSGNVGSTTVDCPYRFTFDSASYPKIRVSVGLSVSGGSSYASQTMLRIVPDSGATTPIAFNLTL